MQLVQGLSQQEVRARQQRGETNAASFRSSRSYWDIVRANLFNFFNNILFAIGIALIALGQYNDAFTSVGQGVVNALIGTVQEINAKRKLDKIALLARTKIRVLRDGQEQAIDPAELVKADVVHVQAGDQTVVDGRVVGDGRLEMDESLLTGEPDLVPKQDGDTLLSGSFCVVGDVAAADSVLARQMAEWSDRGLRVLLFALNPDETTLHSARWRPAWPRATCSAYPSGTAGSTSA